MSPKAGVILAALAGLAAGAIGTNTLRAQGKAPAFVITVFIEIVDAAAFGKGAQQVAGALSAFGAKTIVRSDAPLALDGPIPKRFAIFQFESVEKAKAWYASEAMKESQSVRAKHTRSRSFIFEGLPN